MRRITTGTPQLDLVLGGGLPTGSLVVLAGRPGTGKTILAQQIAFANATDEHPACYYTTLSEPHSKLIRHLDGFSFFDRQALDRRVSYLHITELAQEAREEGGGLTAIIDQIIDDVYEHEPAVVVIDSSKALSQFTDPDRLREIVFDLAGKVSHSGTTVVMAGEYTDSDYDDAPEFAVADVIIELNNSAIGAHDRRWLRVHKLRGSTFLAGQHTFDIGADGYVVHPRIETIAPPSAPLGRGRHPFGIPQIDRMVGGGVPVGDGLLVLGPSGCGKTTLGLTWVHAGIRSGETTLFVSTEESPEELIAKGHRFGFDLKRATDDGQLVLLHAPTTRLDVDEFGNRLHDAVEEHRPTRVVLDALSDLIPMMHRQGRFPSYGSALTALLRRHGASLAMTYEVTALGGAGPLETISNLVQDVLVLRYMERGAELGRVLSVLKMRNSAHDHGLLQFTMNGDGIETVGEAGDVRDITGWTVLGSPTGSTT